MNLSRIYHGGPAGVSGGGGGGGFGSTYPHGLVNLTWAATINTDLNLGDVFTLTLDALSNIIANPTGGVNGQCFTYQFHQQAAPGGPITWGANFVFEYDSLGVVMYPKIFFYDYDFVYLRFIKMGAFFYFVGQWPDFTHQMSDSSGTLLIENLGGVINIRGEDISVDRDITIDVTRDFELDSTRYTDIVSTEDVVFDFGTSFDLIVADYCDIDVGDDLNLSVYADYYEYVANDLYTTVDHDWTAYFGNYVWLEAENSLAMWANNGDVSLDAITGKLYLGGLSGIFLYGITGNIKHGATQVAAGAAAQEVWYTVGHASLPDNVLMIGV